MKSFVDYNQINNILQILIKNINEPPDEIWAIERGGLVPGVHLSHHFNIPLKVVSKDQIFFDYEINSKKKILLVDDINDTGTTIVNLLRNMLSAAIDLNYVKTCTLYQKDDSEIKVDYYGTEVSGNTWIVFPWETVDSDSIEEDESQPLVKCWMVRFI